MVRRYQIRLMRSVNARCVSIGLVLALSNCSESGGEPDAMLDMHHPGTGIDSHHPQFHNSYGNMKFIIIVINPIPLGVGSPRANPKIYRDRFSRSRSQRFSSPRCFSWRVSFRSFPFPPCPPPPPLSFSALRARCWTPIVDLTQQTSFADHRELVRQREMGLTRSSVLKNFFLSSFLPSFPFIIINKRFS